MSGTYTFYVELKGLRLTNNFYVDQTTILLVFLMIIIVTIWHTNVVWYERYFAWYSCGVMDQEIKIHILSILQ